MSTASGDTLQRPSPHDHTSPRSTSPTRHPKQLSTARRDKKRVADRVCQRQARARTKNRIAELEALVAELTTRTGNDACKGLLGQLDRSRAECIALKRKLGAISSISMPLDDNDSSENGAKDFDAQSPTSMPRGMIEWNRRDSGANMMPWNETASGFPIQTPAVPQLLCGPAAGFGLPSNELYDHVPTEACIPGSTFVSSDTDLHSESFTAPSMDLGFPESWTLCDCPAGHRPTQPSNMWKFTSETLLKWRQPDGQRPRPPPRAITRGHGDIAVRAVTEGWGVSELGNLSPSWQILRQIDQKIWHQARPVDRLAVLSIMNILLQCHLNPSPETIERVPAWYRPRPSQNSAKHLYAIDFFVWPGIRERLIYHQHKYCSDSFWALMVEHFRFVWPYDFRDSYVRNNSTGQFQLSELFMTHLTEITSFSFCKDMFVNYPELAADIPKFGFMPKSIDLTPPEFAKIIVTKQEAQGRLQAAQQTPVSGDDNADYARQYHGAPLNALQPYDLASSFLPPQFSQMRTMQTTG